jgi:hypothetical protein
MNTKKAVFQRKTAFFVGGRLILSSIINNAEKTLTDSYHKYKIEVLKRTQLTEKP